jgi:hypothetical protein
VLLGLLRVLALGRSVGVADLCLLLYPHCYYLCRVLVPQLPDLLQMAWSAAAAAAAAAGHGSSSGSSASLGFLVHLVRAHSELRQLDRLFKAVHESLAGLMAAAAAVAATGGSSSSSSKKGLAIRQAVAAAGEVSAASFVAAVRQAVADAPTGEARGKTCIKPCTNT